MTVSPTARSCGSSHHHTAHGKTSILTPSGFGASEHMTITQKVLKKPCGATKKVGHAFQVRSQNPVSRPIQPHHAEPPCPGFAEMRKRLKRQGKALRLDSGDVQPSIYKEVADHEREPRPGAASGGDRGFNAEPSRESCPPAQMADDSRTLVKFIEMNQDFCNMALSGLLTDKLSFKTNKQVSS